MGFPCNPTFNHSSCEGRIRPAIILELEDSKILKGSSEGLPERDGNISEHFGISYVKETRLSFKTTREPEYSLLLKLIGSNFQIRH